MLANCADEKEYTHYISAVGWWCCGVFFILSMLYGFRVNCDTDDAKWMCIMFSVFTVMSMIITFLGVRHYRLKRIAAANFIDT
jgi:hypothetical protein